MITATSGADGTTSRPVRSFTSPHPGFDRPGHRPLVQPQHVQRSEDDARRGDHGATGYLTNVPSNTRNSDTKLLMPGSANELNLAMRKKPASSGATL